MPKLLASPRNGRAWLLAILLAGCKNDSSGKASVVGIPLSRLWGGHSSTKKHSLLLIKEGRSPARPPNLNRGFPTPRTTARSDPMDRRFNVNSVLISYRSGNRYYIWWATLSLHALFQSLTRVGLRDAQTLGIPAK